MSLRSICILPALLFIRFSTSAADLGSTLKEAGMEDISRLLTNGKIVRYYGRNEPEIHIPAGVFTETIRADMRDLNGSKCVEVLYYLADQPSEGDMIFVYNILHRFSKLEGVPYYSVSREKTMTLVETCYFTDKADSKERSADPVTNDPSPEERRYFFQRDTSFGANYYQADYYYDESGVLLSITNRSALKVLGLIPAVGKYKMQLHMWVLPVEGGTLFYGAVGVLPNAFANIAGVSEESFYNRMAAMYSWFRTQFSGSR